MLERTVSTSSGRSRTDQNSIENGVRKNSSAGSALSVSSRTPNGITHRRLPTNGSNLFRRRHIDVIVRNILIALRKPKPSEIHLVYHLISQLNAILQLQRRYLTVSESTFQDEIVTVPTLLKIIDTITKDDFVGWQISSNTDHGLLCRELQLRVLVCGLRLLRLHGLKTLDGDIFDNLTKKLPHIADPSKRKAGDAGEGELYNWNIDFLLVYIRNFLSSLPESRTANAAIVSKIITSASGLSDDQSETISLKILGKSRELLNRPDISDSAQTNWHKIYIDLDDLSWSLVEWHKRAKLSQEIAPDAQDRNIPLIQEIEELVVEQLEVVMNKQLLLLEQSEAEDSEALEGKDAQLVKKCSDDAQHLAYSSLDLLQQLVIGALGEGSLQKAQEISMNVVRNATKSSLRCKAFDILSILTQKGVLTLIQLEGQLRSLPVESSLYLMFLEQRDRSQLAMLTKRRLDEQSEVQTDQSIFKLPDKDTDGRYPEVEPENPSQVATLSFRSRPNVSVPLLADLDEWRTFLSELEMELECEGRKDGKPADDLGVMTCGCVMSEKFARYEMRGSVCPRCHRVTEWKQPAEKLRRMAKLVLTKRMEMGAVLNSNHRFSVVISSPGNPEEFEDAAGSEIGNSTHTSETDQDPLTVGDGGGGFPKEVPWENPSLKYTRSTLDILLGSHRPSTAQPTSGNDSDGSRSTSRNPSITDTASEENLSVPSGRSFPARGPNQRLINQNSMYPLVPVPTTSQLIRRGTSASHSDRHSERSGPLSINGGALTEPISTSPTRFMHSNTLPRGKAVQRPGPIVTDIGGSNSIFPGFIQRGFPSVSTSPIQNLGHSPSIRQRTPSFPAESSAQLSAKMPASANRINSPSTVHMDEEESGPSEFQVPKSGRNDRIANWIDRNQGVPQENTVVRPPLNQLEEKKYNMFMKHFPFYKAEYVHHIPTGGRLRFADIIATAIAPSCTKFAILEKKKFKVFSILASEKTPELLCAGKSTGEYGPFSNQYGLISPEDKVMSKQKKFDYLMAACSDRFLAIAGTHGTLKVHDLREDGRTVYTYISETYDIKCLAMASDGATIALGVVNMEHGRNQTMIVLHHLDTAPDSPTGAVVTTKIVVPYTDTTGTMSFSDDGVYLTCSTLREPRFLVYDLAAQPPRLVMKSSRKLDISHDAEGITSVKFFPGNRLMCVTSVATGAMPIVVDNCIGLLDSNGKQEPVKLVTRLNHVGDKVHGCCTSPTGQSMAALDRSGNVLVLYFPHGLLNEEGRRPRCLKVAKVQGAIKMNEAAAMTFSPDGYRLIIVDRKGDVTIIDFAELDETRLSKSTAWE